MLPAALYSLSTRARRIAQEDEKARAVQEQQRVQLAAAEAAVEADAERCDRAEKLLFMVESRLAKLNDKFEREAIDAPVPEVPVRQFVQEPPPQTAAEAASRALEQRLSKITGSALTLLAVDLPLSRGVVDALAVDKRGRLFLIFFPAAAKIAAVRQPPAYYYYFYIASQLARFPALIHTHFTRVTAA